MNIRHSNSYSFCRFQCLILLLVCSVFTINTHSQDAAQNGIKRSPETHNVNLSVEELKNSNLKIGLALSGGAAKGLAHIGAIKALEEAGIQIDYIAGSSMGALIGAAYASGIPIDTLEKIVTNTDLNFAKLFDPRLFQPGLIKGNKVKKFLYTLYGDKNIEDLPIPFAATATDIKTGKLYVINKGSLAEAVRASISVPIVFTPLQYKEAFLVDGGVVNPVPIDVVREMGAEHIIAVLVIFSDLLSDEKEFIEITDPDRERMKLSTTDNLSRKISEFLKISENKTEDTIFVGDSEPPQITRMLENTVRIAQDAIAQLQIELYKPDLVIEPDVSNINLYEFNRAEDIIEIGYREAIKVLKTLQK